MYKLNNLVDSSLPVQLKIFDNPFMTSLSSWQVNPEWD